MRVLDLLFGRRLANSEVRAEQIGVGAGISIFGLDALSSAAYGPEAALTLLIPLGLSGVRYIVPIIASIVVLLAIVYFSYRQTIQAYPGGGGSYTVARENLGERAGLLAAAALMIDYVLVVAVGISAGVGALVSAVPGLQTHTLSISLGILVIVAIVNLRGVRSAGAFFMAPTYLFVGCMFVALVLGIVKSIMSGGHPVAVVPLPSFPAGVRIASVWLLLQAFASGCTAMTGVEAVSNGVKAFRQPADVTARRTLAVVIGILIVLLGGIGYLVRVYGIMATSPGEPGYQSVLSMLLASVAGRGAFYLVSMASILMVLALSANTAFADFPRLCRAIAHDGYLPHGFTVMGRRLVFSGGIYVLTALSGLLLVLFGGVTDRLIPLFAVGAFLAFTLSQAGMVAHWKRAGGPGRLRNMMVNGLGALATGITVIVVLIAKFVEGAWVTALLIPGGLVVMGSIRHHYDRVAAETDCDTALSLDDQSPLIVIVPIQKWDKIAQMALGVASKFSSDIRAVHVDCGEVSVTLQNGWDRFIGEPMRKAGRPVPTLVMLNSSYRLVVLPIVNYILDVERQNSSRRIAVVVPELVQLRWYQHFLHNKRAAMLKGLLLIRGSQRIILVNVPWYLKS